jgi:hypothetical protein
MGQKSLTPHEIRTVATDAGVESRTVKRFLEGRTPKSVAVRDAIVRALAKFKEKSSTAA